jgi:hypothetical protein
MSSKGIARRRIEYDRNRLRSPRFKRKRNLG